MRLPPDPSPWGFPSSLRLCRRKEYETVYADGKKFHSEHFVLHVLHVPGSPQRVGLTTSRKIGNAVKRNRVKRILREFFRLAPCRIHGVWLVAVARKGAPDLGLKGAAAELWPLYLRAAGLSVSAIPEYAKFNA